LSTGFLASPLYLFSTAGPPFSPYSAARNRRSGWVGKMQASSVAANEIRIRPNVVPGRSRCPNHKSKERNNACRHKGRWRFLLSAGRLQLLPQVQLSELEPSGSDLRSLVRVEGGVDLGKAVYDTTPADIILCWKDAVAASALTISQTQKTRRFGNLSDRRNIG